MTGEKHKFTRKQIVFSVFFVLAFLFLIIAVSFSWFTSLSSENVTATGMCVKAATSETSLEISLDDETYSSSVVYSVDEGKVITPICGNGNVFYEVSAFERSDDYTSATLADGMSYNSYSLNETPLLKAIEDIYDFDSVIVADLYLKSPENCNVKLKSDASLLPVSSESDADIAAAGSCRIAVFDDNGDAPVLKFIWAPNSTYEYDESDGNIITAGVYESNYYLVSGINGNGNIVSKTEITPDSDSGYATDSLFYWGNFASDISFCSLTADTPQKFKVIVWAEGTDRECDGTLSGGRVKLNLNFVKE